MQDSTPAPKIAFDEAHAAAYDTNFAKLAPIRDTLHLLTDAVFSPLPANARILCAGAGTGAEIMHLAQKNPGWHFTAVEPSAPMLAVFRRKAEEGGIAARCTFHEGYLESLPPMDAFDAATSLLVSHFILSRTDRVGYFREISIRLRPGGLLVSADLAYDMTSPAYPGLLDVWMRMMTGADVPEEKLESMRAAYGRDVAMLPMEEVSAILVAGGFENPTLVMQAGLIHSWYAATSH
ncbi:class I SAM-dependent methyltransferase [Prosthecobacter sp. SYSU 5D2]|uniref:class I SAM-dependent methyltransferase n=1 Tax=Prosthecobacter sp. SYSU 5D2 TaxID=3134134 RepID=UPI0031FF3F10